MHDPLQNGKIGNWPKEIPTKPRIDGDFTTNRSLLTNLAIFNLNIFVINRILS